MLKNSSQVDNSVIIKIMKKGKYNIEDIKIGNHVSFKRTGIDDFDMNWTVVGFLNGMIKVKIHEMGFNDELYIDIEDVNSLHNVNDTRYTE